jgi:tetratricopeptide (TPR) repeat protein
MGKAERLTAKAFKAIDRYERAGNPELLSVAVAALRRAEAVTPSGHRNKSAVLANLGAAYESRYELSGDATDLYAAVYAAEQAVDLTPPDDPSRAGRLSNLTNALRLRYALTGDMPDLDAAVEAGRQAVKLLPPSHPSLATCLSNLAIALMVRFVATGSRVDLDAAIDAVSWSIDLDPSSDPDLAGYLSTLAEALRMRFGLAGDAADLNAAIDASKQSVKLTPPGDPNRPAYMSNLGRALLGHFWLTGNIADLNAAIEAHRQVVDLTPDGHISLAAYLCDLASALLARADHIQNATDPGAAVDISKRAVELIPPGHPFRSACLSNLGNALLKRFSLTEDVADLDAAIEADRQAVAVSSPGNADHVLYLLYLAEALIARYERLTEATDLDAAIVAGQEASELTAPGHLHRALCLANLAGSLRGRYERAGDTADLDAVIDRLGQAVALTPPGHPGLTSYLYYRADALAVRYERTRDDRDLDTAISCWQRAAAMPTGVPGIRLAAAQNLGVTATEAGRAHAGADGFAQAVALMPQVAWHGLNRDSRERQLAHWHGLASNAAACAIADGRVDLAVELLEQGRSVLWTQALALRGDLSQLADLAPHLAERLSTIRSSLDVPLAGSSSYRPGVRWDERAVDQRMALAHEWDELIQQVRNVQGFEDYLRAPRLERLLPAAESGPVVIVNVSPWGCDALIVTSAGVRVEHLATLTSDAVTAQARRYLDGLLQPEGAAYPAGAGAAAVSYEQILIEVTAWLWDHIACPVLTALGITGPPEADGSWPRLWWCPTGPLNLLPLHAAGHHTAEGRARHESLLDRVVCSYTPTLRALLEARGEPGPERPSEPDATGQMLVVGLARTPGQPPLPSVDRELRLLATLFPGHHTILAGPAATCAAVREQLPRHRWAHFSCHADQDFADPSHGGILLHDRKLTIEDIGQGRYHGDFAFLSACHTATGGAAVPDEAITLAAALHFTGYRHVIATQWSVYDKTAADVAAAVYTDLTSSGLTSSGLTSSGTFDPSQAARALHTKIKGLRDAGKPLSQWTPFIHTGP